MQVTNMNTSLDFEEGGWFLQPFTADGIQQSVNSSNDTAIIFRNIVERLLIDNTHSHRVSLLVTAAFSLVAAVIVIIAVIVDARVVQQKSFSPSTKSWPSLFASIHKAELIPLAIAIASVIQSCVFLAVQSQSLNTLWVAGCALTSQLIWPTMWFVSFTVTAFSFEPTFRSLQAMRSESHGKVHLLASILIVLLLTLATFITAHVIPSRDVCWGSLVWWAIHFVQPSIALAGGIILVNVVTLIVLVVQLVKTHHMARDERIAASRIVYSLGINVLILALVLPFFICFAMNTMNRSASLMADEILTLTGLLHGLVHLFLRANSERLAIRPRDAPWTKNKAIRLFGPNDLNLHDFISTPLVADREVERSAFYTKKGPRAFPEKETTELPREHFISIHPDIAPPPFALSSPPRRTHPATSSYSIFPNRPATPRIIPIRDSDSPPPPMPPTKSPLRGLLSGRSQPVESTITFIEGSDDDPLELPKPLQTRHRRSDSENTSEIVEFALRLSSNPSSASSSPDITNTPSKISDKQALLTPERYSPVAREAKVDLASQKESRQPSTSPRIVGLPSNPSVNKTTFHHIVKASSSGQTSPADMEKERNKSLPPVPSDVEPDSPLEGLRQAAKLQGPSLVQEAQLTVPDWRIPKQITTVKTQRLPPPSWPPSKAGQKKAAPEGWL